MHGVVCPAAGLWGNHRAACAWRSPTPAGSAHCRASSPSGRHDRWTCGVSLAGLKLRSRQATIGARKSWGLELVLLPCAALGAARCLPSSMTAATLLQNKLWAFLLGAGTAGAAYVSTRV